MSGLTQALLPKDKLMKDLRSGMSEAQYNTLSKEFLYKTILTFKEDTNFTISC